MGATIGVIIPSASRDGVLVSLPNFGDERAVADALGNYKGWEVYATSRSCAFLRE